MDALIDAPIHLSYYRAFLLLFTSAFGTAFTAWLVRVGLTRAIAALVAIMIIVLPGNLYFVNLVQASGDLVPLLFSVLMVSALKTYEPRIFRGAFIRLDLCSIGALLLLFGATVALLFIYVATAMFFAVALISVVLFSDIEKWNGTRRFLIRSTVFFVAACATYFFLQKELLLPMFSKAYPQAMHVFDLGGGMYSFDVKFGPLAKIKFFLGEITFKVLNVWLIYPNKAVPIVVLSVILAGAVAALSRMRAKHAGRISWAIPTQATLAVGLLILIANLPNLAASGGYAAYRTLVPYMAIIVLLVIWALLMLSRFTRHHAVAVLCACSTLALLALALATQTIFYTAVGNYVELNYLRTEVVNAIAARPPAIHIIEPLHPNKGYLDQPIVNDEFNIISRAYPLMIRAILNPELGTSHDNIAPGYFPYVSWSKPEDKTLYMPKQALIINMNGLFRTNERIVKPASEYQIVFVDSKTADYRAYNTGGHIAANMFSGYQDRFWQSEPGFPQWVEVSYPSVLTVKSYVMRADEVSAYMPRSWRLEGSTNGKDWQIIDAQEGQQDWHANEERRYHMQSLGSFNQYRFTFTQGNGDIIRINKIKFEFES